MHLVYYYWCAIEPLSSIIWLLEAINESVSRGSDVCDDVT